MRYSLEYGSYYLKDDNGEIILMADEISILFDADGYVLLKHGSPDKVAARHREIADRFNATGNGDMIKGLTVITGKFPVDELNKIIDCTGYIERFIKSL